MSDANEDDGRGRADAEGRSGRADGHGEVSSRVLSRANERAYLGVGVESLAGVALALLLTLSPIYETKG